MLTGNGRNKLSGGPTDPSGGRVAKRQEAASYAIKLHWDRRIRTSCKTKVSGQIRVD